jgi:phage protein D
VAAGRLPLFDIIVNGKALGEAVKARVVGVTVDESVELPSMFTVELSGSDAPSSSTEWLDDDTFSCGHAVEVKMGYHGALKTMLKGEITALEPSFVSSRPPSLTVRGYDRSHRLQKGRRTRTFTQQKDSDIAAQVAREAGLAADATDSNVTHKYVLQANQTDLEFLRARARLIRYEVFVDDKTLIFRPASNDAGVTLPLRLRNGLTAFYPRLSLAGQASAVSVRGWSEQDKEVYVGQARAGDEVSLMGGSEGGPRQLEKAFGSADVLLSERPVRDQAEADQMAKARLNELALALITGEGACPGQTDLRAGRVIKLEGLGRRFSGNYYVTSAIHRYDQRGYKTDFTVRRNAT